MMEMSRVAGERDQLITLLLPLAEHVLDIILVHFREGSMSSDNSGTTKAVTFGTHTDPRQDLSLMCGMLVPTLERLELLSEVRYLISVYCLYPVKQITEMCSDTF
ncbi:hypothetical protein OIU84_010919 [Salix udensis]|uniref:Uncharacterized protein n=1 Tax=Salix udensis TaxID=889485 RepID=A0AAD6JLT9_9ROSI|nr:hypothetical protein OIU84_010919 [Salix udensis]